MHKIRIALTMAVAWCAAILVQAQDFEVNGLQYTITSTTDHTVTVSGYTSSAADENTQYIPSGGTGKADAPQRRTTAAATTYTVTIPATVYNDDVAYQVTAIGKRAFYKKYLMSEVVIGGLVTSIDSLAFAECTGLTKVSNRRAFPQDVAGKNVFYGVTTSDVTLEVGSPGLYREASVWEDFNITLKKLAEDGIYYLFNQKSTTFTDCNMDVKPYLQAGGKWGTQAEMGVYGTPFRLTTDEETGAITLSRLDMPDTQLGFDGNVYTDATGNNARTYYYNSIRGVIHFTLVSNTGYTLTLNGDDVNSEQGGDSIVWRLHTKDTHDYYVALLKDMQTATTLKASGLPYSTTDRRSLAVGRDVTSQYPTLSLTDASTSCWYFNNYEGRTNTTTTTNEHGTECYEGSGTMNISISGMPNGLYKVSANAFYRDGSRANEKNVEAEGYYASTAYLSANGNLTRVPSWAEYNEDDAPNTMEEFDTLVTSHPNSYRIGVYFMVNDGTMTLAFGYPYHSAGWFIARNLTLEYYADETGWIGDANHTESYAITDVPMLVDVLTGKRSVDCVDAVDVDRDGVFSPSDIAALGDIVLNKRTSQSYTIPAALGNYSRTQTLSVAAEPATSLAFDGSWYVMYNVGRSSYVTLLSDGTIASTYTALSSGTPVVMGYPYLVQFEQDGDNVYIKSFTGKYIGTLTRGQNTGLTATANPFTYGTIDDTHFWFKETDSGWYLDCKAVPSSIAGEAGSPTSASATYSWMFYPVTIQ